MGIVRRGGGGGGGDEDDGDEQLGTAHRRCATCRRELLPWEDVCPDDGGEAVTPGALGALSDEHDALLARLLAEEPLPRDEADEADEGDSGDGPDGPAA